MQLELFRASKNVFEKSGYDPFIDFLKGVSILFVIWLHSMPYQKVTLVPFWAGLSVPLFLYIQSLHVFKRKSIQFPLFCKITKRIFIPFFSICIIFAFLNEKYSILLYHHSLWDVIKGGGVGPGAYYPWLYLYYALILPMMYYAYRHMSLLSSCIITFVVSAIIDYVWEAYGFPLSEFNWVRLRYFFIIWLAYATVKEYPRPNVTRLMLIAFGVVTITYIQYVCNNSLDYLGWVKSLYWGGQFYIWCMA